MTHPLVVQLRFARSEFRRGLRGLSEEVGSRRPMPMNSISWMIGHLAWQEQRYWLFRAQDIILFPELNEQFAYGMPGTTPPLADAWKLWKKVIAAGDPWLDQLTEERALEPLSHKLPSTGTFLLRTTYHYWYHLGEAMAIRQLQEGGKLPDFVGNIDAKAPYGSTGES